MTISFLESLENLIRNNHEVNKSLVEEIQQKLVQAAGGEKDYLIYEMIRVIKYLWTENQKNDDLQDKLNELQIAFNKVEARDTYNRQQIMNLEHQLKLAKQQLLDKDKAILQNYKLQQENLQLKKSLEVVEGHYRQRAELQSGKKIAYKESADLGRVLELYKAKTDKKEIAKILGVSLGTVYNRINELKALNMI